MSKYRVVRKNQFGYGPVTSRNGDKISVALLKEEQCIISTSYRVFEVIDHEALDPEYLMMWFRRPEFDRYARFMSHGSTREVFDWDEMCEVELPVPSIEKQRAIVKEYDTVTDRIKLNEQLNQKLEEAAQATYKHWFVDFEFPNEDGQPYKSSGGEMVYNEELDQEIPRLWLIEKLADLAEIKGGKRIPKGISLTRTRNSHPYIKVTDLGASKFVMLNQHFEYVPAGPQKSISKYIVTKGDLIISIVGTIGIVKIIHESLHLSNLTENCLKMSNFSQVNADYMFHFFKSLKGKQEIQMRNVGAVQAKLPIYNVKSLAVICPDSHVLRSFTKKTEVLNQNMMNRQKENTLLQSSKALLLSKMSERKTQK